ncbi:putative ribonuclease H-like domain-containing protein [Tanacetum coccineum]
MTLCLWIRDDGILLLRPQQVTLGGIKDHSFGDPRVMGDPSTDNDIGIVDSGCSRSMTGNKDIFLICAKQGSNCTNWSEMNKVLFTDTDCLVLSEEFQLPDASQVVLRIPRKHDLYTFHISHLQPAQKVTCLVAKASLDESTRWHRRMAHVNFKTINKLAKEGLVDGLPLKVFTNEHNCVACNKGKQHKASYKHISAVRFITDTLQLLHMDLFGPTNIRSIDQKYYSLVVTDDFSRFSWTFFLSTKDETFYVLKEFITLIENQLNKKVKGIRCDNGTEFKNAKLIELCGEKGIKRDYSNPRTPQQNVLERKNRTSIDAARTKLADSKLPTGKADDGYLVGYASNSKAYRVYNLPNKRVEETLNLRFLEDKPNVQGIGHEWYFDLDYLTDSLDYQKSLLTTKTRILELRIAAADMVICIACRQRTEILCQAEAEILKSSPYADREPALEPTSIAKALEDPDWVDAMQEEMQQFINQQVWKLVPLPAGKHAIGTKWILKNKRDARGIVVRNKASSEWTPAAPRALVEVNSRKKVNLMQCKKQTIVEDFTPMDNVADLLTKHLDGPRFASWLDSAVCTMVLLVVILPAGRMVSAGWSMVLLVVILPAGRMVSAGWSMVLLVVILPAGRMVSALVYGYSWHYSPADKVSAGWSMVLLVVILPAGRMVSAGWSMVLLVVMFPAARLVSAGCTMALLEVIVPAGFFVPAGSYGLCCCNKDDHNRIAYLGRERGSEDFIDILSYLDHSPLSTIDDIFAGMGLLGYPPETADRTPRPTFGFTRKLYTNMKLKWEGEAIPLTPPMLAIAAAGNDAADEENVLAHAVAGSPAEAQPVPHPPPFSPVREPTPERLPETEWVVPIPVSPITDWRPWPSVPAPSPIRDPTPEPASPPIPPAQTLRFEEPLVFGPVPKPAGYVDPDTIDPSICLPTILRETLIISIHGKMIPIRGFHEDTHAGPDEGSYHHSRMLLGGQRTRALLTSLILKD